MNLCNQHLSGTCVVRHLPDLSVGTKSVFIVKEKKGERNLAEQRWQTFLLENSEIFS